MLLSALDLFAAPVVPIVRCVAVFLFFFSFVMTRATICVRRQVHSLHHPVKFAVRLKFKEAAVVAPAATTTAVR